MNVLFLPSNKQISVETKVTLLTAIKKAGLQIEAPCGGHGSCGKCKVLVTKGNDFIYAPEELNSLSSEERNRGFRLACRMLIHEDTCVILSESEPSVNQSIDHADILRQDNHKRKLGLALDVGTTTVEYVVIDLTNGSMLMKDQFYNPQRKYGADVIARISACIEDESNVKLLQQELIQELNNRLKDKLEKLQTAPTCIRKVVLVANTTMCHIFTGHNPDKLARAPFQPDYMGGSIQPAKELGLSLADGATIEVLPFIGGHVGADTVGCLATLELDKMNGYHLLVDIGTNGEMVLVGKDKLLACSTAAGPAFEGGSIAYGMCLGPGAINKVLYERNEIRLQVEGGVRPIGISGTGIIDTMAALLQAGIMDSTGYLKEEFCTIDPMTGLMGYGLYLDTERGVYITRQDIRQLQLAKAAISTGIKVLLDMAGIPIQKISGIWIAGAFGTHLNLENAVLIGLIPATQSDRYHQVGNAALSGAIKRLKKQVTMKELKTLAYQVMHVELADKEEFKQIFLDNIDFQINK